MWITDENNMTRNRANYSEVRILGSGSVSGTTISHTGKQKTQCKPEKCIGTQHCTPKKGALHSQTSLQHYTYTLPSHIINKSSQIAYLAIAVSNRKERRHGHTRVLVRLAMTDCCGSMTVWCGSGSGSGSAELCLWLMDPDSDPDPDPGPGSCYFRHWPSKCQQKTNFLFYFFCLLLFKGTFTSFFKDKK